LRYNFGIINWRLEEIKQIDRKTRNMLTIFKMHHPKADSRAICEEERRRERTVTSRSSI
jgi:hypothetical protein